MNLIASPTHALVAKGHVHIKDLSEESLMVMDVSEASPWHRKIADAFVQFKTPLHLTVENVPIEMIKKMVAVGVGVGFVPLMSVREERDTEELAVVEVDGFHLERSVWRVRRRAEQSRAAKAFVRRASLRRATPKPGACDHAEGRAMFTFFNPQTRESSGVESPSVSSAGPRRCSRALTTALPMTQLPSQEEDR